MELYGFFAIGEPLLTALVDLGTYVYDIFFIPLKDSIASFTLPFIGDLLDLVPPAVWDTFLGDFSLVGLFVSSGALIYVILFFINLILQVLDLFT